jgi:hypothetical protein
LAARRVGAAGATKVTSRLSGRDANYLFTR